ncbi:flagellar assembly peptidoglycan hydrolase FlgJ [Arsenophonus sp.]|uniref:flagellar assembly peptidoglycan hydrolase FlgJ n=1 Tax=Arsenophonus sp. TaxID=1872640 RepID=UPI00286527EC|nr:flagellar assembly peptidoglycan hydrolase FlgJ [Arsenophonus sp.]MDR5615810.1 flagellar assembly peptidoglycan hydrolase FlgJ [Arsenophonus sp.]
MQDLATLTGAAYDARSLNALKNQVSQQPQQGLRHVAEQLESVFVQMMLKSMRAALPQESLFSNQQSHLYTSLYDQQLAQDLSHKSLGFADIMVEQLTRQHSEPQDVQSAPPLNHHLPEQIVSTFRRFLPEEAAGALKYLSENSADFLAKLFIPARIASENSGIPHLLIIAQAALESGWGQRQIMTVEGTPSHNLFGIKAGKNWRGKVTNIVTTEYIDGQAVKIRDDFRVYPSYFDAVADYVNLLTQNQRYAKVAAANTPEQAAIALQAAGYATDPSYAQKLIQLIQQLKTTTQQAKQLYQHDLSDLF